eukprot:1603222-Pyramimonas_sp.AAC.1
MVESSARLVNLDSLRKFRHQMLVILHFLPRAQHGRYFALVQTLRHGSMFNQALPLAPLGSD